MTPVLNTLYLKHNLNASAIGSLQGELISLENDIQVAINQMNTAIEESDKFTGKLKNQ
ncbi:hypothetical protein JCM19235_6133 [Vibrio maritimus]|uniref:Uncharacterized protein n=1 Tax=Vibrio maritimus TaxID=990268 RepID=A0A090RQA7_9VIBR|nr:hypothetical protein JCM19235_6133 [Vibrio maritimus]